MKIQLLAFNCRYSHSCLALFYVRNELEKNLPACLTSIEQFTINDPYYETLLRVTAYQADALFFSVYIWNAAYLGRLLADLNRLLPDLPLVLGGPQAPTLGATLSFAATVVHNEIEGVDPSFYDDLKKGALKGDYVGSPSLTFNSPYKQEDFSRQLKNRNIYYESSRGCPFFCAYCLSSLSRGVRVKGLDLVKQELLAILRHNPSMIRFVDRTFNADPDRTLAIWKFLADQSEQPCAYHFEIAPDLFTEEMFRFLEGIREGLFQFEIGIQSTNLTTLAAVNRKMDLDRSLTTLRRLKSIGTVHLHVDLILGLPLETEESFARSIGELMATEPHYLQLGLLKILPETAIAKDMAAHGIVACGEPPYPVLATRWMDHATVSRLYWLGEGIEAFYNKGYFTTFFSYCLRRHTDMFLFFDRLVARGKAQGFFSLAKTQPLMNDILFSFVHDLEEAPLLREFLLFDWLLSGHRFLPAIFNQDITAGRDFLWHNAPAEIPGLYTAKERNHFFKRGTFHRFSAALTAHCGLGEGQAEAMVGFFKDERTGKTRAMVIPYRVAP